MQDAKRLPGEATAGARGRAGVPRAEAGGAPASPPGGRGRDRRALRALDLAALGLALLLGLLLLAGLQRRRERLRGQRSLHRARRRPSRARPLRVQRASPHALSARLPAAPRRRPRGRGRELRAHARGRRAAERARGVGGLRAAAERGPPGRRALVARAPRELALLLRACHPRGRARSGVRNRELRGARALDRDRTPAGPREGSGRRGARPLRRGRDRAALGRRGAPRAAGRLPRPPLLAPALRARRGRALAGARRGRRRAARLERVAARAPRAALAGRVHELVRCAAAPARPAPAGARRGSARGLARARLGQRREPGGVVLDAAHPPPGRRSPLALATRRAAARARQRRARTKAARGRARPRGLRARLPRAPPRLALRRRAALPGSGLSARTALRVRWGSRGRRARRRRADASAPGGRRGGRGAPRRGAGPMGLARDHAGAAGARQHRLLGSARGLPRRTSGAICAPALAAPRGAARSRSASRRPSPWARSRSEPSRRRTGAATRAHSDIPRRSTPRAGSTSTRRRRTRSWRGRRPSCTTCPAGARSPSP